MKKSSMIKWLNILRESCTIENNWDLNEDYCSSCAFLKECSKICPKTVTPKVMLSVIERIKELEGDK